MGCGENHVSGPHQLEREPTLRKSRPPVAARDHDHRVLPERWLRIRVARDRDRTQRWAWGEPLDLCIWSGLEPQLRSNLAAIGAVLEFERRGADNAVARGCWCRVEQDRQHEPGAS